MPDASPVRLRLMSTRRIMILLVAAAIFVRYAAASLRGDYLGFDESMYIILGRNLLEGHGHTLNGLPNATFPFLISIFAGLADAFSGPKLAVSLPSAILGGAAVIPLFLLAERMASRTVAFAAAALYVGFPPLVNFTPFVSYARRIYEGSEQIYIFFFLFAAYFVWRAAAEGRWRDYVAAGLFCGAAAEVRQDALFFAAAAFAWLAVVAVARREWTRMPRVAVFAVAAFAVALPFLAYVRYTTGVTGTGPRFSKTFLMRDTFAPVVERNDWRDALASYFKLNSVGTQLETAYYGVSPWHRERIITGHENVGAVETMRNLVPSNLPAGFAAFRRWDIPAGFGYVAAVGLLAAALSPRRWLTLTFLAVLSAPAAFVSMALFPLARFWVYLAPFAVILAAWGIAFALETLLRLAPRLTAWAGPATIVIAAALSMYGGYSALRSQETLRSRPSFERAMESAQKRTADWLTLNVPPSARVMASSPQAALLSHHTWLALPHDDGERVLRYARLKGADYIVDATDGSTEAPPALAPALVTILSEQVGKYQVKVFVYDLRGLDR